MDALVRLLRRHTVTPLGLDAYRTVFEADPDPESVGRLTETAEEVGRWQRLVGFIVDALTVKEVDEGWLASKDLYWIFKVGEAAEDGFTDDEIQKAPDALASPAIAAVRTNGTGFKSLGSAHTSSARLARLAELVGGGSRFR